MNKKGVRESMGKKDTFARFPRSYSGQRVEGIAHQQVQKKMKKENWSFPLLLFPPTSSETGNTNSKLGGGSFRDRGCVGEKKMVLSRATFSFFFHGPIKILHIPHYKFHKEGGESRNPIGVGEREQDITKRGWKSL